MSSKIPIWFDNAHTLHAGPKTHPECPRRITETLEYLKPITDRFDFKVKDGFVFPTTTKAVQKGHGWKYIDGDTYETQYTNELVKRGQQMIEEAITSNAPVGFVLIRPPGHHASPSGQSGFCHFNNIWYAAEVAMTNGYKKIAILDWDVHHGDGTEKHVRLAKDSRIKFVSIHAYGLGIYPGTGNKSKTLEGVVNIPLAKGTEPKEYLEAFHERAMPFLCEEGNPDLILVSAGYDAHKDDPMELMNLEEETYTEMSKTLQSVGCPVLFVLEGGYNPEVLGKCVVATLEPWFT
jgi:acetoin utilization deacetylase AcuC-like enzyme